MNESLEVSAFCNKCNKITVLTIKYGFDESSKEPYTNIVCSECDYSQLFIDNDHVEFAKVEYNCNECKHFKTYDDGDGRWDNMCDKSALDDYNVGAAKKPCPFYEE